MKLMMAASVRSLSLVAMLASTVLAAGASAEATGAAADETTSIDLEELRITRLVKFNTQRTNPRVQRYMKAAGDANEEGDPQKGIALLDKLNPKRLNAKERALVYRYRAVISYGSEDYPGAIEYFEKALAEQVLLVEDDNRLRFSVAQLHVASQQWQEAITALERWLRYTEAPDPLGYYLLAIAYYQLEELDPALVQAEKAVDLAPSPSESWLQLLAALYVQKLDYDSATSVLEELVVRFPKKRYWVQLSLIYGARDNYRHSLAVQQIAYEQGFLTEDKELRRLARSYLYHDLPYPAARILEKGLETGVIEGDAKAYELLANSWIAAREFELSLPPLHQAADLSDDGELYVRLGQVYLQREEWSQATKPLRMAVEKGGLKNPGNAQLLLGIAYYNGERVGQALSSFVRARQHDSTRTAADHWISHIEREGEQG
jgi:tetratricopeptide (TPR) repeat protein